MIFHRSGCSSYEPNIPTPQIHHWRTQNLASLIPRLASPTAHNGLGMRLRVHTGRQRYCLHNRKIQSWPHRRLITIKINIVSRGVNPCGGYNNSKWGFSDQNDCLLLMLFRCEVVNYHIGIVVPFSRDWISLVIDCYCTTTTRWIHTAQRPPPRGVFQVLMKVMWLPMVLKKKQHHYILGGVWWLQCCSSMAIRVLV